MTAPEPGLLIVDKPSGMTSHDVVARCRRLLGTRKIGHAGTLDPMATGVLVLGVERATKLLGLLALTTKAYTATIRLGQSTSTDDAEGEVLTTVPATGVTDTAIAAGVAALTGAIEQVPARVSAIKVDGKRAHARVRAGEEFTLAARPVTVSRFDVRARRDILDSAEADPAGVGFVDPDLVDLDVVDLDVLVECSSGTYVRALARDLGSELGVGGHLTALRRTRVGPFTVERASTLDRLADDPRVSLDIDTAIAAAFPVRMIDDAEAAALRHGRWLDSAGIDGVYAAVDGAGRAQALLEERGRRAAPMFVVHPHGLS